MAEKSLFDAISTAIESNGTDLGTEPPDEDMGTGADDGAADDSSLETGDDQDADGDAGEDGEGGEPGEGEADGDADEGEGSEGQPREPNGRFGKKDGEQGDKPGEQKVGKDGKPVKEPDPINDPIPKDVKPETQQRIRTLIERAKESDTKAAAIEQNFNYLVKGIQDTGTTPEQYGEVLSFMALFNSGEPKQQTQALELLEGMADRLATHLGVERKVGDPLANHADLKDAVQKRLITPEYAKEVARQRNRESFRTEVGAHANTQAQNEARQRQEVESARTSLNELEDQLSKSDPQFAAKKAALMPTIKALKRLPPSQWKETFLEAYKEVRVTTQRTRPSVPQNQPMRAGRTAGGGKGGMAGGGGSGPKSMLDAVNAALDSVPR